jgi:hypothetical protein
MNPEPLSTFWSGYVDIAVINNSREESEAWSALDRAIRAGDFVGVRRALTHSAVNALGPNRTPVNEYRTGNHIDRVSYDIEKSDLIPTTPLIRAILLGNNDKSMKAMAALLTDRRVRQTMDVQMAGLETAQFERIREGKRPATHGAAVHFAARVGNIGALKLLQRLRADLNLTRVDRNDLVITPLREAFASVQPDRRETIKFLQLFRHGPAPAAQGANAPVTGVN